MINNPPLFFKKPELPAEIEEAFILYPKDWRNQLLQHWSQYSETSEVYVLTVGDHITTLGILFHQGAPDMEGFPEISDSFFQQGHPYIGYLYTLDEYRGKGYASSWITEVKKRFPKTPLWLTVEQEDLIPFYAANDFCLLGKSATAEEWLLKCTPAVRTGENNE